MIRLIALLSGVVILLICSFVLAYDLIVVRQARGLISDLKTIEVGKTTGQEAVNIAKRFGGLISDVPLTHCIGGDCHLSFFVCPRLLGVTFQRHAWLNNSDFGRLVLANIMGATLEIKQGLVQDLRVWMNSIYEDTGHSASVHVSGPYSRAMPDNRTPWSIRTMTAHITGGPPSASSEIIVEAWPSAPRDRLLGAFEFSTQCLWLSVHCSRCQVLPVACEESSHGDWDEFVMPEMVVDQFRQAVNQLKFGMRRDAIDDRLGTVYNRNMERRLCDLSRDHLPFDFPEGAVVDLDEPPRVSYYVRKWRLDRDSPEGPNDCKVTLVVDMVRPLRRIESNVEGIASRP